MKVLLWCGIFLMLGLAKWWTITDTEGLEKKRRKQRHRLKLSSQERAQLSDAGKVFVQEARRVVQAIDVVTPEIVELIAFERRNAGKIRGELMSDLKILVEVRDINRQLVGLGEAWAGINAQERSAIESALGGRWNPSQALSWATEAPMDLYADRREEVEQLARDMHRAITELPRASDALIRAGAGYRD